MLNDKTQITQLCKVTLTQKCSKETDSKALNDLCGIRTNKYLTVSKFYLMDTKMRTNLISEILEEKIQE